MNNQYVLKYKFLYMLQTVTCLSKLNVQQQLMFHNPQRRLTFRTCESAVVVTYRACRKSLCKCSTTNLL